VFEQKGQWKVRIVVGFIASLALFAVAGLVAFEVQSTNAFIAVAIAAAVGVGLISEWAIR